MSKKNIDNINIEISQCKACDLHTTRTNTVPGAGSPSSRLMLIGEAPGEDEDKQGIPFVGRAGKLLTKILQSVGFTRDEIYVTNIVKCRPPKNRNPQESEIKACSNFLESQIAIVNPKIIVTVGAIATKAIINKEKITKIRGTFFEWRGIRVMPILHPSYLLRNPSVEEGKPKWLTWQDMLLIKREYDKI